MRTVDGDDVMIDDGIADRVVRAHEAIQVDRPHVVLLGDRRYSCSSVAVVFGDVAALLTRVDFERQSSGSDRRDRNGLEQHDFPPVRAELIERLDRRLSAATR